MSQGEIIRLSNLGINIDDEPFFKNPYLKNLINEGASEDCMRLLITLLKDSSKDGSVGNLGLDNELKIIREQFRRFTIERVDPYAQSWHLKDKLLPISLIEDMANLGVFGLTIPEQ